MEIGRSQYSAFALAECALKMTSVRRALAISFFERYVLIAISLASNILIARLLSPEQIGLYSVSLAVIGIAQVLRDFGVGSYLIQEKDLSELHVRTAFGVSLFLGTSLFIVIFVAAPWIGVLYGQSEMVGTLQICAINFLILPFCTVSLALLRREMRFQKLFFVTVTATAIGFVVCIGLAYAGYGANSMAIATTVTNAITGFGAWMARGTAIVLLPSLTLWRTVVKFGAQRSAAGIAGTLSSDSTELVAGKILGFEPVAMLSRAQGLMNLFQRDLMTAISSVAFPAFAKAYRDGEDIESQHIASVGAICVIGWPFYGFVALFSLEILRLMFGTQWDAAAMFVPIYCLAGAVAAPSYLIIPLLTAAGRIDVATRIDLIVQPLRAALFIVGLMLFPIINIPPILFLVAAFCATPFFYFLKGKVLPNDMISLFRTLLKSALVTAGSLILPTLIYLLNDKADGTVELLWFFVAGFSCTLGWIFSLHIIRHPLARDPIFLKLIGRLEKLQHRW